MAQTDSKKTEEILRKLREDLTTIPESPEDTPAYLRRPHLTFQEKEAEELARKKAQYLTDEAIRELSSHDPVLVMLYRLRLSTGAGVGNSYPWLQVVDRDIRARPEAKEIFLTLFSHPRGQSLRTAALRWLSTNQDVTWGRDFMEKVIKLYQKDWKDWENVDSRWLCVLLRVHGNESHIEFLNFVKQTRGDDLGASDFIRRRLQAEKDGASLPQPPQSRSSVSILNSKQPGASKSMQVPDVSQPLTKSTDWLVITILALAFILLACLLFLPRCRRR